MANEIDNLIRSLGTDGFVGEWLGVEAATVLKWRRRNRVPVWHIGKLSSFAIDEGNEHATPEWFTSINLKSAMKGKRR